MSYTRSVQLPGTAYAKGAPKRPFQYYRSVIGAR